MEKIKKIIGLFEIISIGFFVTSCATMFNRSEYDMSISSDLPNSNIIINDGNNYKLPTKAVVARSKEALHFQILQNGTLVNDTTLKPTLSDKFLFGNLFWFPYYLVDLTNDKRYTYGKSVWIDSLGNIESHEHTMFSNRYSDRFFSKYKKGSVNLLWSIPEVNLFHLHPKNETARNFAGFLGFQLGTEYFYKNNKSLQLRGDVITDFIAPVPAPFDWDESYPFESCYAFNVSFTDNLQYKRFQFGYGLNYGRNTWVRHAYYIEPPKGADENYKLEWIDGKTKTNAMLGLALNSYYRFSDHFYFGVIYRPSFLDLSNTKLIYEHSISFDFMWKIHLKTKK